MFGSERPHDRHRSDVPALGTRGDSSEETTIAYCLGIYDKAYTDAAYERCSTTPMPTRPRSLRSMKTVAARTSQPAGDIREAHGQGLGEPDCEGSVRRPVRRELMRTLESRIQTVAREGIDPFLPASSSATGLHAHAVGCMTDGSRPPPPLRLRTWLALGIELDQETEPTGPADVDSPGSPPSGLFALLELQRPAWQRDALCIEYADSVTWFPELGESPGRRRPSVSVSRRRGVQTYAVENGIDHGCWGGVTGRGLVRLRRKTNSAA